MLKNKGITLIALVITIIILLILAGISISALTNQGLFKNAKEAQNATEKAEAEQVNVLNEYEDEINKYLETNEKVEGKIVDRINDGTIKIGDYIKYTPDTASTDTILQELNTYSGSDENTTSTLIQESLNWRVLDVKDGEVRLISELPTTSKITLKGHNGYNNAAKLLDDTCNSLYNNSKLAGKVQNLKIEDITEKMVETDYSKFDSNYGKIFTPVNKYYPSILLKEKEQKINGTVGTELGLSEQTELINQTSVTQASSLEVKHTYWYKKLLSEYFMNSKYYELFIDNGDYYPTYWMSSRCVNANSSDASFIVRLVHAGFISANTLYYSNNSGEYASTWIFRPVVTLNSNVQIDESNSGDGSTAEQAYIIK